MVEQCFTCNGSFLGMIKHLIILVIKLRNMKLLYKEISILIFKYLY